MTWHLIIEVYVSIKKYKVETPPYIQIRLFTTEEKKTMKEVASVNYDLNNLRCFN